MHKPNLALNNQQWLICHRTKSSETDKGEHIFFLSLDW